MRQIHLNRLTFQHGLFLLILLVSVNAPSAIAQTWRTETPSLLDQQFMQQQHERIDTLLRRHFGQQLNNQKSNDIYLLQRLLNEQRVDKTDTVTLQAMGVTLGNLLKSEHGLSWIIYIDRYGRSRALAIPGQDDVIFPITMISRRVEAGIRVDINAVYKKAEAEIERIKQQIIVR